MVQRLWRGSGNALDWDDARSRDSVLLTLVEVRHLVPSPLTGEEPALAKAEDGGEARIKSNVEYDTNTY